MIFCVENKYVLINDAVGAYNQRQKTLVVVNLQDMSCYGTKIEHQILSLAYLKNGILILGGKEMTIWNTNNWLFSKIFNKK